MSNQPYPLVELSSAETLDINGGGRFAYDVGYSINRALYYADRFFDGFAEGFSDGVAATSK